MESSKIEESREETLEVGEVGEVGERGDRGVVAEMGELEMGELEMGEMGEGEMVVEVGGRFVAAGVSSSSLRCRLSSSWTWGRMEEEEGGSGSD